MPSASRGQGYGAGYFTAISPGAGSPILKDELCESRLLEKIEHLSESQQELAAARETLLIERDGVAARSMDVRKQRFRTGNAEASLITALQRILPHDIYSEISELHQQVVKERDILGPMEDDYLDLVQKLTDAEWTFHRKEEDFYQNETFECLYEDPQGVDSLKSKPSENLPPASTPPKMIAPSVIIQYHTAKAELRRLVKQFRAIRLEARRHSEGSGQLSDDSLDPIWNTSNIPDFRSRSSSLLDRITKTQVRIMQLRREMKSSGNGPSTAVSNRAVSEPVPARKSRRTIPFDLISKAPTEGFNPLDYNSPPVEHRVQDWLLDILSNSAVEKAYYLNILHHEMNEVGLRQINDDSWEDRAIQFWGSKSSDCDPFDDTQSFGLDTNTLMYDGDMKRLSNSDSAKLKSDLIIPQVNEPLPSPFHHSEEDFLFMESVGSFSQISEPLPSPSQHSDQEFRFMESVGSFSREQDSGPSRSLSRLSSSFASPTFSLPKSSLLAPAQARIDSPHRSEGSQRSISPGTIERPGPTFPQPHKTTSPALLEIRNTSPTPPPDLKIFPAIAQDAMGCQHIADRQPGSFLGRRWGRARSSISISTSPESYLKEPNEGTRTLAPVSHKGHKRHKSTSDLRLTPGCNVPNACPSPVPFSFS